MPVSGADRGSAVIDLDQMDSQLERTVSAGRTAVEEVTAPLRRWNRPVPAAAPVVVVPVKPGRGGSVRALLEQGRLKEADAEIVSAGSDADATTWTTTRALLDGYRPQVIAGVAAILALARASDDAGTWDRYWTQRWWAALE
ncbi:MAG: hypothetical protein M3066_03550, partial [Actinomycetota bacterium]|nr:hypothetical protein [Actinomycetota bacterium]